MAYQNVKPGRYKATLVDWRYTEVGQKHTPAVEILFSFDENEHSNDATPKMRELRWTGFLTAGAKKFAIKTLLTCGFKDDNLTRFSEGAAGHALDTSKPVSITVENEPITEGKMAGKMRDRIKWVNAMTNFNDAKVLTNLPDIEGDLLLARQDMGVPEAPMSPPSQELNF